MLKQAFLKSLISMVGIFLVGFLSFRIFGPIPFSVSQITTSKSTTFDVSAEGKVTTIPDTVQIMLGVTIRKSTIKEAQNQANEIINKISEELKKLGVKKEHIKTSQYNVYPDYDYTRGQRIVGYNVNITLDVKTEELDKINNIIDVATSLGANQIGQLSFSVNEKKLEELKGQARQEAIKKAKEKAEKLAKDAGMRLGKIINVHETYPTERPPFYALEQGRGGSEPKAITEIQPGESEITVSVTLSYETL